jgi:hypothetical protein
MLVRDEEEDHIVESNLNHVDNDLHNHEIEKGFNRLTWPMKKRAAYPLGSQLVSFPR